MGEKVFTTESGISVDVFTKMAKAGVSVPPELDIPTILGRKRAIAVGKMSGRTSIEVKLKQLGLSIPDDEKLKEILERVKNQSIAIHDALSDEEFKKIATQVAGR